MSGIALPHRSSADTTNMPDLTVILNVIAVVLGFCGALHLCHSLRRAWSSYRDRFQNAAERNLSQLFLFIEPRRLFAMNVVLLMATTLVLLLMAIRPALVAATVAALAISPRIIYSTLKSRRLRAAVNQLPDALLSLATNLRSGMSLIQALETVTAHQAAPLGQELGLVLRELRIGVPYAEALDNLHVRMPEIEIQLVTAAMKVSREIGGNLAEALERISDTLRRRLQMEGKIRSLTAQGKLQGLVMTGLPIFLALALYQLEPRAMRYLLDAWYGWATIGVIASLEMIGYHFIKRIVSIDV